MMHTKKFVELLENRRLLSADLTGTFLGKVPTAIPLQSNNRVEVRITNQGDATAAGHANVLLYASTDTTLDASDVLLSATKTTFNLKAAKSANVVVKFASPSTLDTGSYFLLADVMGGSTIVEQNTANNIFATTMPVTITKPFVDLTDAITISPRTVSYTVGAKKQVPLKLTVVVTNNGNVPAKGPLAISLFGSGNLTLDAQDPLLLGLAAKPIDIKSQKSKVVAVSFKPTSATQSGTFYVIAQINAGGEIAESDTDNDTAISSNQLTIDNAALPIGPKLVGPLTDDVNAVVIGSQQVTFMATVLNETSTTAVEIDEVDASGNPISKIADLYDNGNPANGDVTAGDGIFSCIVPISFDTAGTRYFVATLTDPTTGSSGHTDILAVNGTGPILPGQVTG